MRLKNKRHCHFFLTFLATNVYFRLELFYTTYTASYGISLERRGGGRRKRRGKQRLAGGRVLLQRSRPRGHRRYGHGRGGARLHARRHLLMQVVKRLLLLMGVVHMGLLLLLLLLKLHGMLVLLVRLKRLLLLVVAVELCATLRPLLRLLLLLGRLGFVWNSFSKNKE